jgi:hypothetical protein
VFVLALSNEFEYFELFGSEVHHHDPFVIVKFVQIRLIDWLCKERSLHVDAI